MHEALNDAGALAELEPVLHAVPTAHHRDITRGLLRATFLFEPVNESVTSTKFAVRWDPRFATDPRGSAFDTCLAIWSDLVAQAEALVGNPLALSLITDLMSESLIPYELPLDYIDASSGGSIHTDGNLSWITDEQTVAPPNALVLFGSPADIGAEDSWGMSTWQFVVTPGPEGGSRLLTRGRSDYAPGWKTRLAFGRFPMEVITFVMSRKMMLEIKRLAES